MSTLVGQEKRLGREVAQKERRVVGEGDVHEENKGRKRRMRGRGR